jgi:methionyl-tRNA formyltransferase
LVLTRPDQPAGRGMRVTSSPVKQLALEHALPVFQPASLRPPEVENRLREVRADVLVVVAYGLLVPSTLLELPRLGAVNVHASLLPRWRGAAPIQRALLAGDASTGVSIMKMDAGLDTGPVYERRVLPIAGDDDAGSLHDKLASLGGEALVAVLQSLSEGHARAVAQPSEGATYAAKIDKREARLDWQRCAAELERVVRAFRPSPGATALLHGEPLKVLRAGVVEAEGPPGMIVDAQALVVACGVGGLRILEVQRAGRRPLSAGEFLRGTRLERGMRFE